MEKGKLSVTKSGKGKIVVELLFEGKKGQTKQTIQNTTLTDTALNGKDVEFERENGQVVKVICDEKVIYAKGDPAYSAQKTEPPKKPHHETRQTTTKSPASPKSTPKTTSGELEMDHVTIIDGNKKAKAPYNFIPLNTKVAEAEPIPDFDQYHPDRHTGWIDLEIETQTPLYIRDTLNSDEMKKQEAATKENPFINPDFFSPGGKLKIPGSSLRGMIRTLIEIVSYGRFGEFDNRRLYFRAVADTSSLGSEYKKVMVDENNNHFPKIEAGLLEGDGYNYRIYPSITIKNTQIYRVNFDKVSKVVDGPDKLVLNDFEFRDIYFQPVEPENHTHIKPNGDKHELKYALLKSVSLKQDNNHPTKGYIIASGPFGKKKHMHWVINESENQALEIPESVVREYQLDVSRSEKADLMKGLKEGGRKKIPCFFIRDENRNIISFGHTGMFRLAYEKTIGDHIPADLKYQKGDKYDIPTAIFGNAETFAGRVFFEDALLKDGQQDVLMKTDIPKLLQTPKPTTFQHYLVQPTDNLKDRRHYNDNSAIRGNKMYWHKSGNDWIERDPEKRKNKKISTKITPVKPKTIFTGRIRFENLSTVELGALMFALDLPEGCFHKLGMGKPIGLGSVRIKPELHLSDRKKRYKDLFFEWEKDVQKKDSFSDLKQAFEKYVLTQVGNNASILWETDRMKELKTMLNFEKGNKLESEGKIRYMEIEGRNGNEFKRRPILPLPSNV